MADPKTPDPTRIGALVSAIEDLSFIDFAFVVGWIAPHIDGATTPEADVAGALFDFVAAYRREENADG